jgi:hypothetical protein
MCRPVPLRISKLGSKLGSKKREDRFGNKSIKDNPKKKRGRPATGKDPLVGVRMSDDLQDQVRDWAEEHDDLPLATAIRRLVELGLGGGKSAARRRSAKSAERAKQLAAKTIDRLADPAAATEEAARRKRRLLKGPEEFRELRRDLEKKD